MKPTMFVGKKTPKLSPNTLVQVVANVRHGDRVRQKIIRHFGTASTNEELALLVQLAELFIEYGDRNVLFAGDSIWHNGSTRTALANKKQKRYEIDLAVT